MPSLKLLVRKLPFANALASAVGSVLQRLRFRGAAEYWEKRYEAGGSSGLGSVGKLAEYKARFLNDFIASKRIRSVVEIGCGDGNQLSLAEYPRYTGLDISQTAIDLCKERYASDSTKQFFVLPEGVPVNEDSPYRSECALSLDVIYHLVEETVYQSYMHNLFALAEKHAIVYSSDTEIKRLLQYPHIRHRRFTEWVESNRPDWRLTEKAPNPFADTEEVGSTSAASFFVFEKRETPRPP
jgi:SAM-dependent methyltransferase